MVISCDLSSAVRHFIALLCIMTAWRKLLQGKFARLTGLVPRGELNLRFFDRQARRRSQFPTVPVWHREATRHYDM